MLLNIPHMDPMTHPQNFAIYYQVFQTTFGAICANNHVRFFCWWSLGKIFLTFPMHRPEATYCVFRMDDFLKCTGVVAYYPQANHSNNTKQHGQRFPPR